MRLPFVSRPPQLSDAEMSAVMDELRKLRLEVAMVVGAGILFTMYSDDLGTDVFLAIVACLA